MGSRRRRPSVQTASTPYHGHGMVLAGRSGQRVLLLVQPNYIVPFSGCLFLQYHLNTFFNTQCTPKFQDVRQSCDPSQVKFKIPLSFFETATAPGTADTAPAPWRIRARARDIRARHHVPCAQEKRTSGNMRTGVLLQTPPQTALARSRRRERFSIVNRTSKPHTHTHMYTHARAQSPVNAVVYLS